MRRATCFGTRALIPGNPPIPRHHPPANANVRRSELFVSVKWTGRIASGIRRVHIPLCALYIRDSSPQSAEAACMYRTRVWILASICASREPPLAATGRGEFRSYDQCPDFIDSSGGASLIYLRRATTAGPCFFLVCVGRSDLRAAPHISSVTPREPPGWQDAESTNIAMSRSGAWRRR